MENIPEELILCEQNHKQYFLVSVTVYKARHLRELNCDTFVMVSCNGRYKRTRIAYRTDNPYFNEYFSFSLYCSEQKLRRKGVLFSLYQPSICTAMHSCIGEFHVDLNTVLEQQNHTFCKKWAMFEPVYRTSSNEPHSGYLLIDLCITSSSEMAVPFVLDNTLDYDVIEKNRLLPTPVANDEIQRVRFCFSVFQGEFVNSAEYAVRISYAGLKNRTKNSSYGRCCRWNEKLSFVGSYPSTNQIFGVDLLTSNCCHSNVKSSKDLHFSSMSKRVNDILNLPTFGPSWIYLYSGSQESQYVGRLLVSFNTEVLSIQSVLANRTQTIQIYEPLILSNYWEEQVFVIEFSIVKMQLFAELSTRQLLVYLSCADIRSKAIILSMDEWKPSQRYRFAKCAEDRLSLKLQLPDYRHKYVAHAIVINLYNDLKYFANLLQCAVIRSVGNNLDLNERNMFMRWLANLELDFTQAFHKITGHIFKQHTKLDQLRKEYILQQLSLHKSEIAAMISRLGTSFSFEDLAKLAGDVDVMLNRLLELSNDDQNQYPDILLHVFRVGHPSVNAIARFSMVHYLHQASSSGVPGVQCGKRCTILLRSIHCNHSCPDRCGCIYAKLDYQLQIGTECSELATPDALITAQGSSHQQKNNHHLISTYLHCKIHVYQGRIYAGFDESKLCKVKLSVLFEDFEMTLSTLPSSLSSCWNETVDMKNVPFFMASGTLRKMIQHCTVMLILHDDKELTTNIAIGWIEKLIEEVQSDDSIVDHKDESSTRLQKSNSNNDLQHLKCSLQWIPLFQKGLMVSEILVSTEIVKIPRLEETNVAVEQMIVHGLPPAILPALALFRVQAFFVGLRQMRKRSYHKIKKSRILVSIGEANIMSGSPATTFGKSANFPEGFETCTVRLPANPNYWPLMTIKHVDFTNERQMKIIGQSIVNATDLLVYSINNHSEGNATIIDIAQEDNATRTSKQQEMKSLYIWPNVREMIETQVKQFIETKPLSKQPSLENAEHTWWTKFYENQLPQENRSYALKIYGSELEKVSEFNGFKDWSGSYMLHKISDKKKNNIQKKKYGVVKCLIQIQPDIKQIIQQHDLDEKHLIPSTVEIIVVVYVVQALNLLSRDIMSESDAYIKLSYGKKSVCDRAYYIPNQASPVFGRRFELRGILPRDQIMQLSVYDRDFASSDDLIGSTSIDIEDRFRSKHFPCFGLPNRFSTKGCNKWRHQMKPSEMLLNICELHGLGKPRIEGRKIFIGQAEFEADVLSINECITEQLCLLALNNLKHVVNGFSLTPEHVETRSLYHPKRGGIEQGKVQLWVELYEPNRPHPLPVDITPQPPKPYELRLIVWNTADVMLNERNIFGTEMSDIYVKCWLQEFTEAQYTDVHYRSLTGEGNFNWRMVFPFRYSSADGMLVLRRRKAFYEQYDTELKYPPVLTVQIWDNDSFSADDFLGTVDLNLTQLCVPASTADACTLPQRLSLTASGCGTADNGSLNLFVHRRVRGWFPVHGNRASTDRQHRHDGMISLTGKIELELEILSHEDAVQNPVGVGRKPPQHLPEPLRPEVSFNWLRQPAKTFNKLLWPRVRKSFIWIGIIILLCLVLYGLVINVPTVFMVRSLEQRQSVASTSSGK